MFHFVPHYPCIIFMRNPYFILAEAMHQPRSEQKCRADNSSDDRVLLNSLLCDRDPAKIFHVVFCDSPEDILLWVFPYLSLLLLLVDFLWYSTHREIRRPSYRDMESSSPPSILEGMRLMENITGKDKNYCASHSYSASLCSVDCTLNDTDPRKYFTDRWYWELTRPGSNGALL